jgi:uncharacterized protein (DUF2267 family)
MSNVGLESIDHTVQLTHQWINDLDTRLGWDNKHRSFRLLRAVLQAVRDWLPVNDAAHFGAQLPELLRGIYYEQWRPAATPVKDRSRSDFIERIDDAFANERLLVAVEAVTMVFDLLCDKLSAGEIEKVRHSMPADLRALWPSASQTGRRAMAGRT